MCHSPSILTARARGPEVSVNISDEGVTGGGGGGGGGGKNKEIIGWK